MYNVNVKINFSGWMKVIIKIKIISLIIFFMMINSCVSLQNVKIADHVDHKYLQLKQQFTWMNPVIYKIIVKECDKYKISRKIDYTKLMCSIIQAESGEYCNNNYEYMTRVVSCAKAVGLMQIMKVHTLKNPNSRYNPTINVQKGVAYYTECLQKAMREGHKNPIKIACAYYNAGSNCKLWRYKNWGYVNKIVKYYGV